MKKLLLALLLPLLAFAWEPKRSVTVVFPNGPGAGNEISFRFVANIVEKKTGATFVSEHRPGADGNIAMNHLPLCLLMDIPLLCQLAKVTG